MPTAYGDVPGMYTCITNPPTRVLKESVRRGRKESMNSKLCRVRVNIQGSEIVCSIRPCYGGSSRSKGGVVDRAKCVGHDVHDATQNHKSPHADIPECLTHKRKGHRVIHTQTTCRTPKMESRK